MSYIPARGDIAWITIDLQAGHEKWGRRPVLIVSPAAYNEKVGLALCCPIASQVKGYPFEVNIPQELPVEGVVLTDQVKSFDWKAREVTLICQVPGEAMDEVLQKLATLLLQ